ncbi:MAG: hypothetical protein HXX10_24970 [Rhodoplanes sp.]|uniref:hypothetical protein n=1 Tax=Rhodoplanes sp. TaxID=1968906 RepID=UPI00180081C5|nr:hypothetical protein [Rhodoplanes sp.]NVO17292.1 hypothetical protein [Rhodoplanes sp.]
MKAALVFVGRAAAASVYLPYRSRGFICALAEAGVEPVVIDVDIDPEPSSATVPSEVPGIVGYRNQVDRLPLIVAQERVGVVQTFGATEDLGSVWGHVARAAKPLAHFVSSDGAVADLPAGRPRSLADLVRRGRSLAHWQARHASRHVTAVLGSNRADLGRHFRHGFFPRARFSAVAPPPSPPTRTFGVIPLGQRRQGPVLGFWDPDADAEVLELLLRAVALTGQTDLFTLKIAPASLAGRAVLPPGVTVADAASADAFLRDVDVLVVPRAEDRALCAVVAALAARKSVIVPDTGAAIEIVDYGRRGLLYAAGSAYHLAMAINVMAQSWTNRPFSFDGVEESIARTAPDAVARMFASAWRRLGG